MVSLLEVGGAVAGGARQRVRGIVDEASKRVKIEGWMPSPPNQTRTVGARFDAGLTPQQLEEFGRKLDALRARVLADLGDRDRQHIYRILKIQRGLEVSGRALFFLGFLPPAWLAAVGCLSLSKILDNLELGHNVMHGQYDWMREKGFNSRAYEWDNIADSEAFRYTHNFRHHTFTNIVGVDRDMGFGVMRLNPEQPWHPYFLANPLVAAVSLLTFEWGASLHVLELDVQVANNVPMGKVFEPWWRKAVPQALKDYVFFPALTGPLFPLTLAGNVLAGVIRNLWVGQLVFMGHFPEDAQSWTMDEIAEETRGQWYLRQLVGSANFDGPRLLHILSGGTGHQIEHHLFPDIPATRYPELAEGVRAICHEYGLPYNTGSFLGQVGEVWKRLFRLALP